MRRFVLWISAVAVSGNEYCRARQGDASWPSPKAWSDFNSSVSGMLLQASDPFAPCVGDRASSDCEARHAASFDSWWLTDEAGGYEKTGYAAAYNVTTLGYVVAVKNAEQVAATVRFAAKWNLRLVVKNTGHDYIGRSLGTPDSLTIWTHGMQNFTFQDNFIPRHCGKSAGASVVHLGAGVQWFDVYQEAIHKHDSIVAGGGCMSVGAGGGFWMGGGYNDWVRRFGTGAANVVEVEVILADGSVVVANDCGPHRDLFWALKGGGGGTFGVVTRTTMLTHPAPASFGSCHGKLSFSNVSSHVDALEIVISTLNATKEQFAWGGAVTVEKNTISLSPHPFGYDVSDIVAADALAALKPIFDAAEHDADAEVVEALSCNLLPTKCFWDFECNKAHWERSIVPGKYDVVLFDGHDAGAYLYGTFNRYLPVEESASRLAAALVDVASLGESVYLDTGLAGLQGDALLKQRQTSMLPQATSGLFRAVLKSFETGWQPAFSDASILQPGRVIAVREASHRLCAAFPEAGSYMNTGSYFEPDWQENEWGSHYPALLKVKKAVDPDELFVCRHCVGSEAWSDDGFCRHGASAEYV